MAFNRGSDKLSNEEYLVGIYQHDTKILESIFKDLLPGIERHVLANKGTKEAAQDIFMDALEVIYRKVDSGRLELTCAFYSYLFAICKNLWFKKLRRKKYQSGVTTDDWQVLNLGVYPEQELEQTERYSLYREKFASLGEDCRKILQWFLVDGKSMKEIASLMGFKSDKYARKRKFQCKQKLTEMIKKDDRFDELKGY
jgi:RNA polymerase sigma factor (sigma-70 family)